MRMNVTLSPYDYTRLKLWGITHGKSPSAFAGQLMASCIEANFDTINRQIADYANSKGMTVEELKAEIANGEE